MAELEIEDKKDKLFKRLKNKYRLVIMNKDTFEEKASLMLSPMNVITVLGSIIIFLVVLVIYIVAFTPLREYIPGYADVRIRRQVVALHLRADSLEDDLKNKTIYLNNINDIIMGNTPKDFSKRTPDSSRNYENVNLNPSGQDSSLRVQVEKEDNKYVSGSASQEYSTSHARISGFFFFTPIKGTVTSEYSPTESHYGVDVVAPQNETIKATLDGTVIFASWTSDTGYVIGIQHENNLVSVYKHNSVLLKKVGSYVKAGEGIAIIGNSGELTTGPHLHFELWYNGNPINPLDYVIF